MFISAVIPSALLKSLLPDLNMSIFCSVYFLSINLFTQRWVHWEPRLNLVTLPSFSISSEISAEKMYVEN